MVFKPLMFFLFLQSRPSFCMWYGNPNCIRDEYSDLERIQCPVSKYEKLIIHVRNIEHEIGVDCLHIEKALDLDKFPKSFYEFPVPDIDSFTMKYCVWMSVPFYKILERFNLSQVASLEFTVSQNARNLTADLFMQLSELRRLILSQNQIQYLDEDVFESVPKLTELDLSNNKIVLTKNLFKTVPYLEILDLSNNSLQTIPAGIFQPLTDLKVLHLWSNRLTKLDGLTFQGLLSLQSLEISINQIKEVTEDAFHDATNLTQVNLSGNQIKGFFWNLFQNNTHLRVVKINSNFGLDIRDNIFANSSVTHIDLQNCKLRFLPPRVFRNARWLNSVTLKGNDFTVLPNGVFGGLKNLTRIYLQNNKIVSLKNVFKGLTGLKILFLQHNLIQNLPPGVFADLVNLKQINLQQNKIKIIHPDLFSKKKYLERVNLSFNRIITPLEEIIPFEQTPFLTVLNIQKNQITTIKLKHLENVSNISIKLDFNKITTVNFYNVNVSAIAAKISLRNNPIICDCRNYKLVEYLKSGGPKTLRLFPQNLLCHEPPEFNKQQKKLVDLSTSLSCPFKLSKNTSSEKCDFSWIPVSNSILVNCSYRNLTEFPTIDLSGVDFVGYNQSEGWFQGNDLKEGPKKSQGYENMTKLFLSHNKIRKIDWLPPRLEVLALDHNHITKLPEDVVQTLNNGNLLTMSLGDNRWVCDCDSEFLANFLRTIRNLNFSSTDVACFDKDDSLLNLKESDLCLFRKKHVIPILVLSFLLTVAIIIAFYFRYQKPIKIWLFSKNLCLWWVTEEELDNDKKYDAFISYMYKDEDAAKKIVQVLESKDYKLCFHERDWVPGEFIPNQITNSVLQSRRTIVILSKNFLKSGWGRMEFQTAHTHAMTDARTRVIIILYDDVDINTLDEELKMYLKTNTYVKWDDPYFWEKLNYALPHRVRKKSNFERNLLSFDEEVRLIEDGPTAPGSTPPISSNPSFTKVDPLSLVS